MRRIGQARPSKRKTRPGMSGIMEHGEGATRSGQKTRARCMFNIIPSI